MRYVVNEECIACGLCVSTCPEVFSLGEEGTAVAIDRNVPESVADAAAEAMESCPVSAIEEV